MHEQWTVPTLTELGNVTHRPLLCRWMLLFLFGHLRDFFRNLFVKDGKKVS